jgi:D-alanyl-D-alanine carboxypeptidase/D-alanyl-D-alanine-endopeptidase (penicillin-binding protein 4)
MNRFAPLCLLLCIAALPAPAAPLPDSVTQALKRAHIPLSDVGIVVQAVDAPAPLIAVNAGRPMNPASTMKLLTTFAALETLGPAYRWKTEAYLDGALKDGVLQGDLVFKGYGDPKLTLEQFWMWLRELRQRGLRDIRGDIVLDHGYFADDDENPGDFDRDPTRAYNVGTSALLLNFNAIRVHLIPDGRATTALLEPELAGYAVENHIAAAPGLGCHGGKAIHARLQGKVIRLDGRIGAGCGEVDQYFSLLPHDEYFFAVFSALWKELGGTVQGGLRAGSVRPGLAPFATYVSPELAGMIRDINKFSNNIMARQVFLTLGVSGPAPLPASAAAAPAPAPGMDVPDAEAQDDAGSATVADMQAGGDAAPEGAAPPPSATPDTVAGDTPASAPRSIAWMRAWLAAQHLQFPELVLENGSGLSRRERISPLHLARLLQQATRSRFYAELESSLPILGMDGTVKRRFRDSDLAGHAHLKTGTLDGVKAMAGYVDGANGQKWIVTFIINHANAARGQAAQDALIAWLEQQNP